MLLLSNQKRVIICFGQSCAKVSILESAMNVVTIDHCKIIDHLKSRILYFVVVS